MKTLLIAVLAFTSIGWAQYAGSASGSTTAAAEINGKINHQEGSGAPSSLNCTIGKDQYTDTATGDLYGCKTTGTPGTWTKVSTLHSVNFTIDGGGSVLTTGSYFIGELPAACTITGWSLMADQSGSVSIDIDAHANATQATTPSVPNTTTDKISASAPMALSSAQSVASTTLTGWTTSRALWDSIGINVVSATTITRVTGQIFCR